MCPVHLDKLFMYRSSDDHLDKLFMCILEHGEHVAHDAATRQLQGATCQMGSSYGLSGVEVGDLLHNHIRFFTKSVS